jgi:hypothetical protein
MLLRRLPGLLRSEGPHHRLACQAARVLVTASWLECPRPPPLRIQFTVSLNIMYLFFPFPHMFKGFPVAGPGIFYLRLA